MEQEKERLRQEIADTRRLILNQVDEIAHNTLDGVHSVSEGVLHTARSVEKGVKELSLQRQVQKRPFVCVGAAVAAGYLAGRQWRGAPRAAASVSSAESPKEPGVVARAASAALPVVIGIGASLLGEWAKQRYPKTAPYISLAEGALLNRL